MTDNWTDAKKRLDFVAADIGNPDIAFTVHYWGATPRHGDNPVHRHSFFEVCYVIDGEGVYAERGNEQPLRAGTLFVSRPGLFHQIRSAGMNLIYVAFETNEAKSQPAALLRYDALKRPTRIVIPECQHHPSVLLWHALLQLAADRKTPPEALVSAAHALLFSFLPAFREDREEGSEDWRLHTNDQHIKQATLFIRNNLSEPLQLRGLADYLHMSARHLSRLFANTLGLSFSEYVRIERLRFAEQLLADTDMPLKEIARETGFQSIHHFTRCFCERKGLPPGKYREAGRTEQAGSRSTRGSVGEAAGRD